MDCCAECGEAGEGVSLKVCKACMLCIPRSKRRSEVLLVEGSFASSQLMVVVVVLVGLGWIPLVGWMRDLRKARDLAG